MSRLKTVTNNLLILLWPAAFPCGINIIDSHISRIVLRTYDLSGAYWLLLIYTVSGLLFAFIASRIEKNCERKENVVVYVGSLILVIIVAFIILSSFTRVFSFGRFFDYIDPLLLSLSLGFTLYTASKSIVLYKRHTK